MPPLFRIVCAIALASTLLPQAASAQPPSPASPSTPAADDKARARQLHGEGIEAFRRGKFAEARDLFEAAFAIDPHPILVYNVARASESLGDEERAIAAYRSYLELDPAASDRGAVEQRIANLEGQAADERELAQRLQTTAPENPGGQLPDDPPPPEPRTPSPIPWAIAGTGAVGVGVGIALAVMAQSTREDAEAEPIGLEAQSLDDEARTLGIGATVALVVGGALTLGGTVGGVVDVVLVNEASRTEGRRTWRLTLGATSMQLEARY
jgi:tetratricopeptide (TPR) repeat protein